MLLNPHYNNRKASINISQDDEDEEDHCLNNSQRAPNSFLLYKVKRSHEMNGRPISSQQLLHEWQHMSMEHRLEFQNQSRVIQLTLDIDNGVIKQNNNQLLPKMIVPTSMVIPNDNQPQLSDLLIEQQPRMYQPLSPISTASSSNSSSYHHNSYSSLTYSAAAEAAALESLSFNHHNHSPSPSIVTPSPPQQQQSNIQQSMSIKKKYGDVPEKVKRPPNAYLLFNRDMRRQLHDVNQGLTSGEISKSISLRWKQLSDKERAYYVAEETKLKQQHNNQHAHFIYTRRSKAEMNQAALLKKKSNNLYPPPPPPPVIKKAPLKPLKRQQDTLVRKDPRGRKKKKLDDHSPKHPMSAYLHFAKKMRPIIKAKFPDARLVDISKQIGVQWRSMTTAELQPFVDLSNQDKERYAQEMKYRLNNQKEVLEELDSHTIATVAQMVNPLGSR